MTKRRTKEKTNALIAAERNLDQLWDSIDQLVRDGAGDLRSMAVTRVLSRGQVMQRTPEWIEPTPVTSNQPKPAADTTNLAIESLYKPLSTLYLDHSSGGDTPGALLDHSEKTKTKTRPKDQQNKSGKPSAAIVTVADPSPTPVTVQTELIQVDSRALKVFRTLFYDPAVTTTPGEVSWADFIYAMTSTGEFTAEKLYGSVWQFARIDGQSQSRIQFHEPHPRGKVPFVVARRHGRRLNRAYGWTRETFALK